MEAEIKDGPAFAYVDVRLAPGESILAEPDAMLGIGVKPITLKPLANSCSVYSNRMAKPLC